MKKISLTQGLFTIVDDIDYEKVNQYKWRSSHGYAVRTIYLGGGQAHRRNKVVYLHKILMGSSKKREVDHKNGNPLDNRRKNLRSCTRKQNMQNSKGWAISGYKGVYKAKNKIHPWVASIKPNRIKKHLGYFPTKEAAAKAYNEAAKKYFGQFARLNLI